MGKVICMQTRKKWTGSRTRRPPVKVGGSTAMNFRRSPGGEGFTQVGEIAATIVERLTR